MSSLIVNVEISKIKELVGDSPIVYFCAEFAVSGRLPLYAGGLGVLAGDVVGQADEDKRPFVAIGMLYHHGYLQQEISKDSNLHHGEELDVHSGHLQLLCENEIPVSVSVAIQDRTVWCKVWVKMIGSVPLLLLDTDVSTNDAQDISICDRLYYGDKEHRFKQEIMLGIGGLRVFRKLGIVPRLFHLNEGHSALLLFELARELKQIDSTVNVHEALTHMHNVVFTNHTLVPAGNDVFSQDLVLSYLGMYAEEFPVDVMELVKLGLIEDSSLFSPTMLALRLATVSQAVSKLHATKALEVWPEHPMVPVTNGVRQSYWQAPEIRDAADKDIRVLWEAHQIRKRRLIQFIVDVTGERFDQDDLFIGWSRRIAGYKRPLVLFEDEAVLATIVRESPVPVRFIFSGKPHAHDLHGQEQLKKILAMVKTSGGSIVYIPNYQIEIAQLLLSGIDVLLNTPVRGFEACGTSGMKACMNGVLLCTTKDGWTDEVDWNDKGFLIDDARVSAHIYELLSEQIIPLFIKRDETGLPTEWIQRMQTSIAMSTTLYSAKRMLEELEQLVYSQVRK